ncbi:MAG TPA: FHA domain-containing protein [Xanthomonadaceae bacterium]|nr:FHA domain-containing protein [Xanthomonadaceae bacterium]
MTMKLLFPNGEHSQALLSDGPNRVGSDPSNQVVLTRGGVAGSHCVIVLRGGDATVEPVAGAAVSVNGTPITATSPLRPGDLLVIGEVQVRAVGVERAQSPAPRRAEAVDDTGATRLRMAVPRLILRGVSGAIFGKTYPVGKEMVIGRQQDCDIPVPAEEISRHHARVKPTPDGLAVEDLGSANGTFINDKRVQQGLLKPGDELRLDTVRFLLIAPGMEMARTAPAPVVAEPAGVSRNVLIGVGIAVFAVLVALAIVLLR